MTAKGQQYDAQGITQDGEIVPISRDLGLRGRVLRVGWELPHDLSEKDWRSAGELLGKIERSVSWWLGDWWAFGEAKFRGGKALVEADEWEGPDYGTLRNVASICRSVPMSRRRDTVTFSHHAEVASLPQCEADALLDWAEETIAETGKPRSTRELRAEVNRRRVSVGAQPSTETCTTADLKRWAFVLPRRNGHAGKIWDFEEKKQGKYDQLNDTWGRIVPVSVLEKEANAKRLSVFQLELFRT